MFTLNNIDVLCLDGSCFGRICKQQITNLTIVVNENNSEITKEEYTRNVYALVLAFFENLKCLSVVPSSVNKCPLFSLRSTSENVFSSSTLTKLCIHVYDFNDCLRLLDGRLKQLTTLTVQVRWIPNHIPTFHNHVSF